MTDQDTAALAPPSLLRLMVHQNLYLPVIVLLLALALSFAPDPTSPTAKGISPRVLALPLAIAGLLAMVLAILRALSQRRAIASGIKISCTVRGHEDGTGTHGLPRFRISWTDPDGRAGRSVMRRTWWVPPVGKPAQIFLDPRNGRQWWEGDLPHTDEVLLNTAPRQNHFHPKKSEYFSWPSTWIAIFALACGLMLLAASAGWLIAALPLATAFVAAHQATRNFAAYTRAGRHGRTLQARVLSHDRVGSSLMSGPSSFSMQWQTSTGHFGSTNAASAPRLIKPGGSITVCIDPVTQRGWWQGDYRAEARAQKKKTRA